MLKNLPLWSKSVLKIIGFIAFFLLVAGLTDLALIEMLAIVFQQEAKSVYQTLQRHENVFLDTFMRVFSVLVEVSSVAIYLKFYDKTITLKAIGLSFYQRGKDFLLGCFLGVILITTGFMIMDMLGYVQIVSFDFHPLDLFLYVIFFIAVAVSEEVMVRGYILNTLLESTNKYIALVVSALIFASLHLMNANIDIIPFINLVLAGLLLGLFCIYRKNLMFPIGLHFTWNYFQGPIFGYEVSGHQMNGLIHQKLFGEVLWTGGAFGFEGSIISIPIVLAGIYYIYYAYNDTKQNHFNQPNEL
jgi:membrane protease YdiL (CAAX protease family)